MRIHAVACGFLKPYFLDYAEFVDDSAQADFVLMMYCAGPEGLRSVHQARAIATARDIPLCWWTIEDPNAYLASLPQARVADFVFTSDKALIPTYCGDLRHDRVYWLPLAACERFHYPVPLREDATDFVFSGNWYRNEARDWGTRVTIIPLAQAGYSVTVFSLERPPFPELQSPNVRWIKGDDPIESPGYFSAVALQYAYGKVALGQNNQRSGMDGIAKTYMTSMRTFEALACGKPLLAPQSDAYQALDLQHELYITSDPAETLRQAELLRLDQKGRTAILANHTYGHRLRRIARTIAGEAEPEDWR